MSFQPVPTEKLSLMGEVKIQLSHKNFFVDPEKNVIDDSHIHSCYEIYLNLSGSVSFLHGDNIYMIKSGDIIFSEPGEVHHCIYKAPCVHDHYCLWFEADAPVTEFIRRYKIDGYIRLSDDDKENLIALFLGLEENNDSFEKGVTFCEILRLLKNREAVYSSKETTIPKKLREILEYIDERFLEINSVGVIADKFHVSIPTVNRWFREHLHLSPTELIRAKRLSYAEKLVKSDYSVTDACFLSGFTDLSRFISLFKKNYGKTPLQYKKG